MNRQNTATTAPRGIMVPIMILMIVPILALAHSAFGAPAQARAVNNPELRVRVDASFVQKLVNQAIGARADATGTLRKSLEDFNQDIPFTLSGLDLPVDAREIVRDLGKVNLQGSGNVNVLLEKHEIEGNPFVYEPKFSQREDGTYEVLAKLQIRNFGVRFERVWFTSAGVVELDPLSPKSCHALITSPDTVEGKDFILSAGVSRAALRSQLIAFYKDLNRQSFRGHEGHLWARIDGLRIGWKAADGFRADQGNVYAAQVKLIVDPKRGGKGIQLVSFTHNLYRRGGAFIPVRIPKSGIILPPSFVRTQSRQIVGDVLTDNEIPRCTWIDQAPAKKAVSALSGEISKQVAQQLSSQNIQFMVTQANNALARIALPELPESFVVQNEDRRAVQSSSSIGGITYQIYKDIDFDFEKDLRGLIKNFTTYRAALGFGGIRASANGDFLEMPIDADLKIDGTRLIYREDLASIFSFLGDSAPKAYSWGNDFSDDGAIAVSGKLLNRLIDPIKDHILKTQIPYGFSVHLQDNLFSIDAQGRIDLSPRILVAWEGIDLVRVTFPVKARPTIETRPDAQQKPRTMLKLQLDVPDAATIIGNIRPSTAVSVVEVFANLVTAGAYSLAIKPEVQNRLKIEMQKYINELKANIKEVDLTDFVNASGVRPSSIHIKRVAGGDSTLEVHFSINEFKGLNEVMRSL